eukprot:365408-Chlamydomonas_euryale.AAC.10
MFGRFLCPLAVRFSVQFSQLLDALAIFEPLGSSLSVTYPGPSGELSFECVGSGDEGRHHGTCRGGRKSRKEEGMWKRGEEGGGRRGATRAGGEGG